MLSFLKSVTALIQRSNSIKLNSRPFSSQRYKMRFNFYQWLPTKRAKRFLKDVLMTSKDIQKVTKVLSFSAFPLYTNGYDLSNRWSIGTNGTIPMVLLVNMHLINWLRLLSHVIWLGTGKFRWSIGTNRKWWQSNGSIG